MWLSSEPVHEVKIRIQRGKGIHKVQTMTRKGILLLDLYPEVELFPARSEFEMTPCELGRSKMNFSLMYEKQVFLMGLPVN